ncbi:MAG: ethyl tert-butyl ether degradation protein EthD [Acidobacteria bacterium]|nr:MAG: ethyl tert-butyl ether degradation protein EthD [Acidobacteriota bacterium]
MPKLIVLYPQPANVATFEQRYRSEHAPMVVQKVPGLKKFLAAQVLGTPAGAAPYQRVAELYFDSMESLQAAMTSEGGKATVAHAMEISTGGPPIVLIAEDDKAV